MQLKKNAIKGPLDVDKTLMQFLKLAGLYCNVIRLTFTFKSQFITKQNLNANIKTFRTYLQGNKAKKITFKSNVNMLQDLNAIFKTCWVLQ